jgi:hypothetical protein
MFYDKVSERALTDEASVGKNESPSNPHTFTEGPEPAPDHNEVIGRWLPGMIDASKTSCFHLFIHGCLAGEAEC